MIEVEFQNFKLTIKSLDTFEENPDITFEKCLGDVSYSYVQRVVIEYSKGFSSIVNILLYNEGCYTELDYDSFFQINDYIFFCSGAYVCKWNIMLKKLEWRLKLDLSSCFTLEVIENQNAILVSGESELSKINFEGFILWSYSGSNIFVTEAGKCGAEIVEDRICITDWDNMKHILDLDGKLIEIRKSW